MGRHDGIEDLVAVPEDRCEGTAIYGPCRDYTGALF